MGHGLSESGRLAEEYLGGRTTLPRLDPSIVDQLEAERALVYVDVDVDPKLQETDRLYKEQLGYLPTLVKGLIVLVGQFNKARSQGEKDAVRRQMIQLKKELGNDRMLKEALIRYVVKAQPAGVDPTEPGTLDDRLPMNHRNNFIYHLHSDVCDRLKVEDPSQVMWYSAIGTPLDILFGTDGFFVVDGEVFPDKKRRLLAVDITRNMKKVSESRGDDSTDQAAPVLSYDVLLLPMQDVEDVREMSGSFAAQISRVMGEIDPDVYLDGFNSGVS